MIPLRIYLQTHTFGKRLYLYNDFTDFTQFMPAVRSLSARCFEHHNPTNFILGGINYIYVLVMCPFRIPHLRIPVDSNELPTPLSATEKFTR